MSTPAFASSPGSPDLARPWRDWPTSIARREREVRDTLWLLLTMGWVLSPHLLELPIWCSTAIATLIVWRAWLTWGGRRLPNRWIPVALTCIAGLAVWVQYRTIFGKDAGVAYVTLLLGLKLLEMRARRDIFVVIFLCLFVMLTSLFESQTMVTAGALLVGTWMLTTALVSVHFAEHEPPWRVKAMIALRLVLFGLPLMAVLFVLFPRVDGPLWGMPSDAFSAKSGLSDVMAPGTFGRLALSRELAFRVQFEGRMPKASELYWRGPVLGAFDGRAWTPLVRPRIVPSRSIEVDPSSAVDYSVTLEPIDQPWLFALDVVGTTLPTRTSGAPLLPRLRSDLQVTSEIPIRSRAVYRARSYTRYRAGLAEDRVRLQQWLELPPSFNPRTHAFAAAMQADEDRAEARTGRPLDEAARSRVLIDRVITMIRTQAFSYTLDPPPLGRDSVDEFLFVTRRGYCEHYASAFVVLMRALDIPSRVVTGYQGGEINPVDQLLEVRQRDAHAWAEVWIAGQGWIRVDPTAAVAPERIERGAAETFSGTQGIGAGGTWLATLLQKTRFNWDAIGNAWDQWILAYNADRQSSLLAGLGIERVDWQMLTTALVVMFGAVLSAIGAMTLWRRSRVDPVVRQFEKACALLARAVRAESSEASARRPSESSRAYLDRIGDLLPPALRERAVAAFDIYEALRYGRRGPAFDEAALRSRFATSVSALRG